MNEVNKKNKNEKPPKRKFWQNLLIMDSGDLKKVLSLSSLMLSILLLFIYLIAYILLMPLLDKVIGGAPVIIADIVEAIVPATAATGVIMIFWPLFRDKRVLPAAYLWLLLISIILFVGTVIALRDDKTSLRTFLYFFAWDGLPSLIIGNFAAWRKYLKFLN